MGRKIGEIFEYNGEWYQCVKSDGTCNGCVGKFQSYSFCNGFKECVGKIFKKLEKAGEPYRQWLSPSNNIMFQRYRLYGRNVIMPDEPYMYFNAIDNTIEIEIKQTKEDMEDLDKIKVRDYTKVEELNVMEEKKLNLKPFDIQKARDGKPVCTRDGRKVRVLCYDFKQNEEYPILVAVENKDGKECALLYSNGGISEMYKSSNNELAMLPEKKEGWVNIVRGSNGSPHMGRGIFQSKEEAENAIKAFSDNLIDTVKISWGE